MFSEVKMKIEILLAVCIVLLIVVIILQIVSAVKKNTVNDRLMAEIKDFEEDVRSYTDKNQKDTIEFLSKQLKDASENTVKNQTMIAGMEDRRFKDFSDRTNETIESMRRTMTDNDNRLEKRFTAFQTNTKDSIETLRNSMNDNYKIIDGRFESFQKQTNEQMRTINGTMEKKVSDLQASNEKKLEEMRRTVDEKLQKTLEERISNSFKQVSERLEQVYTSLGEMQKVGAGVDDLKKVLSNVKTRGILGEVQLGAILEEILSPEQYETNIATKKGSSERVEFAVKMPGGDNGFVYLPIDAKFPLDAYRNLTEAEENGTKEERAAAETVLKNRIKQFAKDIRTKYIDVPNTTDFAIMFLPLESLYAEVLRLNLVEELQKEKINVAGPTTMAALLNSLQMGFRTLAIQKRSNEVWTVLEGVKTEFAKFGDVLSKTQDRMRQAQEELDKLVTTRTNAINRKLKDVSDFSPDSISADDKKYLP